MSGEDGPSAPADSRDVFISYASEDREIAWQLKEELEGRGLTVWFDETVLVAGQSLRRSIDRGLAHSRAGVVILSPNFFRREWPQAELDGFMTREKEEPGILIPVWHKVDAAKVREYSLTLADKVALKSSDGIPAVADGIERALEMLAAGESADATRREAAAKAGERRHDLSGAGNTRRTRMLAIVMLALALGVAVWQLWLAPGSPRNADVRIREFDPAPSWRIEHRRSGSLTQIRGVTARDVPATAEVELRCRGTDCEGTTRRFTASGAPEVRLVAELLRILRGPNRFPITLHPATRIEIRVTKLLFIGEGLLVEINRRAPPTLSRFCIGQEKPECRP